MQLNPTNRQQTYTAGTVRGVLKQEHTGIPTQYLLIFFTWQSPS